MTLEDIKKFRDEIGKGKPIIVTCDNQHIFYENVEDSIPLIWDDSAQTLTAITVNNIDQYSPSKRPMSIEITEYEHIQFIQVLLTTKEALELLNQYKSSFGDDADKKYEYAKYVVSRASNSKMAKGPYTDRYK